MRKDISKLLNDWPLDDGSNARLIKGIDGKDKIQIRVCIDTFHGLLQFEADGRPDGARPHNGAFYLDYLEHKRDLFLKESIPEQRFHITHSQCEKLFEESSMVYHRYVVLLQMGDFPRVIADTARNMRLFRFVNQYASREEDREHLECWWPYILRIHYTARTMEHLSNGSMDQALEAVQECRARILNLKPQENEIFQQEYTRSIETLEQMERQILEQVPISEEQRLIREQQAAIAAERYEDAARFRDMLRGLRVKRDDTERSVG